MRKKIQKTRCEKRMLSKCNDTVRTYDDVQYAGADYLNALEDVEEIRCNVILENPLADYMTDFVCRKTDGDLIVRECVFRKYLTKPKTIELLQMSLEYWARRGVKDWGLIIDKGDSDNEN